MRIYMNQAINQSVEPSSLRLVAHLIVLAAGKRRIRFTKAVSVDFVYRGRRIGGSGLTQALIELLVCEQRVHVYGGRE